MNRVLLLMTTTTYRAGAFLEAARRIGAPAVFGSDRAQTLVAANPGGHLTLDFLDPEQAARDVVEFARQYPIGAVIAADDDGVVLGATVAAALGLRHNRVEAVLRSRNKLRMREVLKEAGIPTPNFRAVPIDGRPERVARELLYPCVLKPLFLSASRGVIRANDPREFVEAFRRIAAILTRPEVTAQGGDAAREILVEAFLPGPEVALEGLLSGGRLRSLALFDKPGVSDGPFFEETIYVTPSRLAHSVKETIESAASAVVSSLGLEEGAVHAEFRVTTEGPRLLEIAPRSIGGLCSRVLRFGRGVSLEELILRHSLGQDVRSLEREEAAAGVMMIPIPQRGVLTEVAGADDARAVPGIEEVRLTLPVAQEVVALPEGTRYLGFVFARDGTPDRVVSALREAHRRMSFVIEPADEPAAIVS